MIDWSSLGHAYGSAEDVPARLARLESAPTDELWDDLWSALCHQGTVYSASYAALHWLTGIAGAPDRRQAVYALALAGAILGSVDRPVDAGDVRSRYAGQIEILRATASRYMHDAESDGEYVDLLETLLVCEGAVGWPESLCRGLQTEEYELDCPGCGTWMFVALGRRGTFTTVEDYALRDDVDSRPLIPASPDALTGVGLRLYRLAVRDERLRLADMLLRAFGEAHCPECDTRFTVSDLLMAG
ncbi:hypothetical protein LX16_4910 [Stackebrandtia albiflava]|uniref:Uncharacterized protein n=1 Tax=Stackebrandtia albiflava TaxID=406432 RepID=A0A562UQ56_9ACTN|nr:hypothetical protein [Stackebrandtia albiflava]TWJ07748.1 hypothetical protein LX16_4910 [Stackebrandtia albiflava]